ncbi:unnamed protein product [Mycena citricolor]|uniref:DNA topoisomerase n=1 Tax=Mycena citricolor TaxID=2018698 RepID=A0AAD2HWD4_9AGAR|nr:unnamed protein product [Mycena citricolor]
MRVLCVAEKPSISKAITEILSGGQFTTRNTSVGYIKNYDFDYPRTRARITFTCVTGHLMAQDFPAAYRSWTSCDPLTLFDAPVETSVAHDKKGIEQNLLREARGADTLMIWTDCDREGEHIGSEIRSVCRKAKPNILVKRARFSAIIGQQIHNAVQNPVELDQAQADAVQARMLLDLRIGAAFSRMQTLNLQNGIPQIKEQKLLVSYGPCQFPTLGFVVQRYKQVKNFVPEPFWYIYLSLSRPSSSQGHIETVFNWRRNHLFDHDVAAVIYEHVLSNPTARVTKVVEKNTKKYKPLPLTTVELQKAGSRLLKLAPKKVLDIAESLYQKGFLSYPRTETDQFDPQFDFHSLIERHVDDPNWGTFARNLQQGGFNTPRRGKNNDQAHPPIHPTANVTNLANDEKRVYEFITRRFLACCSKDAEGSLTTVDVVCGGEDFYATGLVVHQRNYLEVYVYDKWTGNRVPDFEEGEQFNPTVCELREGSTTSPKYLTEADLVTLMDKNGIGTDATIAQHIDTIVSREYALEEFEGGTKYLIPSTLGLGLVEGYDEMGFEKSLSKPHLRRETERNIVEICNGTKTKGDVLADSVDQYRDIFIRARGQINKVTASVQRFLDGARVGDGSAPARGRGRGRGRVRGAGPGRGDGGGGGGNGDGGAPGGGGAAGRGNPAPRRGGAPGRNNPPVTRNSPPPFDPDDDDDFMDPPPPPRPPARQPAGRTSRTNEPPPRQVQPPPLPRQAQPLSRPTQPPTSSSQEDIRCDCGEPAGQRTVTKESATKGKKFWTCDSQQCRFFKWVEDVGGPSSVPAKRTYSGREAEPTGDRKCKCGEEAVQRTVVKEGDNKGRKFWNCGSAQDCDFFEWDDAVRPASSSMGAGPSRDQDVCYKCNQSGHWASSCPNGSTSDNSRFSRSNESRPGSSSMSASSGTVCYKVCWLIPFSKIFLTSRSAMNRVTGHLVRVSFRHFLSTECIQHVPMVVLQTNGPGLSARSPAATVDQSAPASSAIRKVITVPTALLAVAAGRKAGRTHQLGVSAVSNAENPAISPMRVPRLEVADPAHTNARQAIAGLQNHTVLLDYVAKFTFASTTCYLSLLLNPPLTSHHDQHYTQLPWFIRDLGVSIVGKECYTSLVENLNIGDVQCIKYSISKGLGIGIVLGGSIMKVPQLLIIVRSQSARGLSLPSYILETLSYAITLVYAQRNEYPFSTYGENLFLTIQNIVITLLIILYAPRARDKTTNAVMACLALLVFFLSASLVSMDVLAMMQLATLPLSLFSKLPQIRQNYTSQSTGNLSAFAVFAQIAGCAARLFTTAMEVNDPIVAAGFLLALLLNIVLGVQLSLYWGRDDAVAAKSKSNAVVADKVRASPVPAAYESVPLQQRAATPPPGSPSMSGRKWARKVD